MKKIIFAFILASSTAFAQGEGDKIMGYYLCADPFSGAKSQIRFEKVEDDTYQGRVVWVEDSINSSHIGLIVVKNLRYNSKKDEWQHAVFIYPGKSGKYSGTMSFVSENRLKIRAYRGVHLFGKTLFWTKEQEPREM